MANTSIDYATSLTKLRKITRYCKKCGSNHLIFDNKGGWTGCTVRCYDCKQSISKKTLREAVKAWNELN